MIFFGIDSSDLPKRYTVYPSSAHTEGFVEDTITSTLNAYYNYLNILGRRMHANPATTIEIIGCRDTIGERHGELSLLRANTVANYLIHVWGVSPARIKITSRGLPEQPSNMRLDDGREENRRVEILSKDWELVKPVVAKVKWQGYRPPGERYEIIRFKFDSYEMGQTNQIYFKEYILPRLRQSSIVKVSGHENFYDPEQTIGFRRAKEVAKQIKSSVRFELNVETIHPQVRYDNSIPEGRFYHRSVLIEILP
jgi:hypothetical protein